MFRLPSLRITMFAIALTVIVSELPLHGENILYLPALQGANAVDLGVALVNPTLSETTVTLTARNYNGNVVQGAGIMNPVTLKISALSQKALMATEIFGPGISGKTGWVELSTSNPAVTGFFLTFDSQLSLVDGAGLIVEPSDRLLFPNVTQSSILTFVHTGSDSQDVLVSVYGNNGSLVRQRAMTLFALSGFSGTIGDLFPGASLPDGSLLIEPNSAAALPTLVGIETFKNLSDVAMVKASALSEQLQTGYFAHLVAQGGYDSRVTLVNPDTVPQTVAITAEGFAVLAVNSPAQTLPPVTVQRTIPPHGRMSESVAQMFNLPPIGLITGQIRFAVDANSSGLIGYADYGTTDGVVLASVVPQRDGYSDFAFSQLADGMGFYTGLAILNANNIPATISLDTFDNTGRQTGSSVFILQPGERRARLLRELIPNFSQVGGYAHLTSTRPVLTYEIFGSDQSAKFLANVPAQGNSLKLQRGGKTVTSVDGANVFSPDGSYLIVPPFALNIDTKIDVSSLAIQNLPRTSANEVAIGGVQGTPSQTQFDIPARLTFPLQLQATPGAQLVLLDYDAATGQYARTRFFATVDESGRNASVGITQLGSYVIAAPESGLAPMNGPSPINIVTEPPLDTYAGVNSAAAASQSNNNTSLANSQTMTGNSANFYKANPVQHLWDSCWTTSASCTAGGMGIGSFWVEFDFGALYNLTSARLFGDAKGTWWSKTWTLQYKVNASDPWSTAFSAVNAFLNNWSTQQLSITARYVHVEVFGNPLTGDTEARELQIYGAPQGVTAGSLNQPPTVNAGAAQTITLPSSATLNGSATDDGLPVGSTLTVTWSQVSGPGTVTFANASSLRTTASFSAAGTYSLRLTASDTALSSASDVTITVNPAATGTPVVNAGPNQTITLPSTASLSGTATGFPAGSTLTETWSKVNGTGTVTFSSATSWATAATFSTSGTYTLRLTVNGGGVSSSGEVAIAVNPALTSGPTFYVSTSGSDSNSGGSSSPWRTIQKAANTLSGGSTVIVAPGQYNERVTVSNSGSSGNYIVFQGQSGGSRPVMRGFTINASFVQVDGFEITHSQNVFPTCGQNDNDTNGAGVYLNGSNNIASNNYIHDTARSGALAASGSNNIIRNNTITAGAFAGIWLQSGSSNQLAEGNDISQIVANPGSCLWASIPSWYDANGIEFEGRGQVIRSNKIHDINGSDPRNLTATAYHPHIDGIQTIGASNAVIERNDISIPKYSGYCEQSGMFSGDVTGLIIRNNLFHDTCRGLNFLATSSNGPTIVHNTFVNFDDYGSELDGGVTSPVVKNNIYHSITHPYVRLGSVGGTPDVGNNLAYQVQGSAYPGDLWGVDPQFVNVSGKDFHIQSTSPAINTGVTLSTVKDDRDGTPRPQGAGYDRGAYEFK